MAGEDGSIADRSTLSRRPAAARADRARPQMGGFAPPQILMRRGDAGAPCDSGAPAPGAAQLCPTLRQSKAARPDRLALGNAGSIGRCSDVVGGQRTAPMI